MSKSKDKAQKAGSINQILLIVFIVLKLTNNIDWSWWWVLSPLWIPLIFVLIISTIIGVVMIAEESKK